MRVLQFTLTICAIAGCWRPLSWISTFKYAIYNGYRTLLISILLTFNITQVMNIVMNVNDSDEFTNTVHMMLTVYVAFNKIIIMWLNCTNVTEIIMTLTKKPFAPMELGEVTIRQKYDKIAQWVSSSYREYHCRISILRKKFIFLWNIKFISAT